jgi:hypothetical protein
MKSKIGLLAIVLISGLALSACTNKSANETTTDNNQQNQTEARPSGTPDGRGPGQQMDFVAAAKTLGVTEEALKSALGWEEITPGAETTPGAKPSGQPKQMDLTAAAKTLGVTEEALKEALGLNNMPSGAPQRDGNGPQGTAPTTQD